MSNKIPSLQPGWHVTYQNPNTGHPETATIARANIVHGELRIALTDGRSIQGRLMTALGRTNAEGRVVEAWLAKEADILREHRTPAPIHQTHGVDWSKHWRRLVRATHGIHEGDPRLDAVVGLLQECEAAYQLSDESHFLRIEERLKHFLSASTKRSFDTASSKAAEATDVDPRTDLARTFAQLIGHLLDRLTSDPTGEPKTFKATTITHLIHFLNETETTPNSIHQNLVPLIHQAKALLAGVEADALRNDRAFQAVVRTGLARIKTELDTHLKADHGQNRYDDTP